MDAAVVADVSGVDLTHGGGDFALVAGIRNYDVEEDMISLMPDGVP